MKTNLIDFFISREKALEMFCFWIKKPKHLKAFHKLIESVQIKEYANNRALLRLFVPDTRKNK